MTARRKEPFLIKSLVRYIAFQDSSLPARGLDLKYGQVVAVLDAYDKQWWKACPIEIDITPGGINISIVKSDAGLIPSEKRYQKKFSKKRLRGIKFRDENLVEMVEYVKEPQTEEEYQEIQRNFEKENKAQKKNAKANGTYQPFVREQVPNNVRGSVRNLANRIESNIAYKNLDKTLFTQGTDSPQSSQNVGPERVSGSPSPSSINHNSNNNTNGSTTSVNSNYSGNGVMIPDSPVYEYVQPKPAALNPRPIIVLGHLRDRINDKLQDHRATSRLGENGQQVHGFASVVPHTTRRIRAGEIHGQDYFFVSQEEMMADIEAGHFIEAGKYNESLYGTSIQSIQDTAKKGMHSLLDVSGSAIESLLKNNIHPIVILPVLPSHTWIQDDDPQANEMRARALYEKNLEMQRQYVRHCTAQINVSNVDDIGEITEAVLTIIDEQTSCVWQTVDNPTK